MCEGAAWQTPFLPTGCPEIHIWEPKPHSADLGRSHIMAADLSTKRLIMFVGNIYRFKGK